MNRIAQLVLTPTLTVVYSILSFVGAAIAVPALVIGGLCKAGYEMAREAIEPQDK
jgi:hypothetical protein